MDSGGRPRDPHIGDAVLDATAEVLSQVGYARLTFEEVARRAGTTKPSIYRRWRGRQELVLAALSRQLGSVATSVPDSGCVVCDLVNGVGVFVAAFNRMPPGVLGALLAECEHELRTEFTRRLFAPPRSVVREVVDRAKVRGDLRAGLDGDLAVDLLGSFVHYRALFEHAATDRATVEEAVTTLLRGMAADFPVPARRGLDHQHTGMTN